MTIETPCVGVCRLDPGQSTCLGCGRTLAEIAGWGSMGGEERLTVMRRLAATAAVGSRAVPEPSGA